MKITSPLKIAVVTGGKSFDVPGFYDLFNRMKTVTAYIQHIDDYASSLRDVRSSYDGVLFFIFMREPPSDTGIPAYSGHPETVLKELDDIDQGIILMHHSCLSFPGWGYWDELCGIYPRHLEYYSHNEQIPVHISRPEHPIVQGLEDWTMTDEVYRMTEPNDEFEVILESSHPQGMKALAWTGHRNRNRMFCTLSGHDRQTWENRNFIRTLEQGIHWACRRDRTSPSL